MFFSFPRKIILKYKERLLSKRFPGIMKCKLDLFVPFSETSKKLSFVSTLELMPNLNQEVNILFTDFRLQ